MVGVPGRSKGCNTCIQRKIRCDQETPQCGNCRRTNRLCAGYKRKLGYVLSRDVSVVEQAEPSRSETTVVHQGRWRKTKPPPAHLATHQAVVPFMTWINSFSSPSPSCQVSAKTALRQQLQYIFLNDHFPAEMLGADRPKVSVNWLLYLQDVDIQSQALETALAAFFAARMGRKNNDMNMVHQSHAMYVRGIEQLRRELRNPQTRLSDQTLAACMTLSVYELTESPGGTQNAFTTHQMGAMMLLKMRGPNGSESALGHSLFLAIRSQTLVKSIVRREETFLSRPAWMEKPWQCFPKTPLDEISDVVFGLPAVFQQFDSVFREQDQNLVERGFRDIVAKCLKLDSAFRGLLENFAKTAAGPLYWPELSTFDSPVDDAASGKVFPVSFHFPNFFVAQMLSVYWSSMMAIHHMLMYSYDRLAAIKSSAPPNSTSNSPQSGTPTSSSSHSADPTEPESRKHGNTWKTMAKNICQSVEYFCQDSMGWAGPVSVLMPLRGCKGCFQSVPEDWGREIRWITHCIEQIHKKYDFRLAGIMGS